MMLFHGTTEENAKLIMKEGFKPDKKYNWQIKSKTGFVYLSLAYASFYANAANGESRNRALIKVEVKESALYPDEDYLMHEIGKPKYTQADLNRLDKNRERYSDKTANSSWKLLNNRGLVEAVFLVMEFEGVY